jgi:hypothetical protein
MATSGMLRRAALVRIDNSEALSSSETSILTRAARRNIPEDAILQSHGRENFKSDIKFYTLWNITACSPVNMNWRFVVMYNLSLQCPII